MKVLIFGSKGQVGLELSRRMPKQFDAILLDRIGVDLIDPRAVSNAVQFYRPDAVINVAAFTDVDLAEEHEDDANLVNGLAPEAMARSCAELGIPFLHVSTDYVFDGSGSAAHKPDAVPAPVNAYGRSKLLGETRIVFAAANSLILRTSWVFSAHRKNFLKTMLRLGREKQSLDIVADQFGGPTPASAIADALLKAATDMHAGMPGGLYHFSAEPDVSRSEFARFIMMNSGLACEIKDVQTSDYPTRARRPLNSRLDCSTFVRDFQIARPDWRSAVKDIIRDLGDSP